MCRIFKRCKKSPMVTNEYRIRENVDTIVIRTITADVVILPGEEARVICLEEPKVTHKVAAEQDTLLIDGKANRKWYQFMGRQRKGKVTVLLPKGEYKTLWIKSTTGDVLISEGFTFETVDISVTTGGVCVAGVHCQELTAGSTTGDLTMNHVIAKEKLTITGTTGHVALNACDAAEVDIQVTTGNVKGTLLSEKTFEAKTVTGKVDVPKSRPGGLCKVHTTTGCIDLDIQQKDH